MQRCRSPGPSMAARGSSDRRAASRGRGRKGRKGNARALGRTRRRAVHRWLGCAQGCIAHLSIVARRFVQNSAKTQFSRASRRPLFAHTHPLPKSSLPARTHTHPPDRCTTRGQANNRSSPRMHAPPAVKFAAQFDTGRRRPSLDAFRRGARPDAAASMGHGFSICACADWAVRDRHRWRRCHRAPRLGCREKKEAGAAGVPAAARGYRARIGAGERSARRVLLCASGDRAVRCLEAGWRRGRRVRRAGHGREIVEEERSKRGDARHVVPRPPHVAMCAGRAALATKHEANVTSRKLRA